MHGITAALTKPSYSLAQFAGLKYGYDNSTGAAGALASIPDRSTNGRTLTVSASQPQGFPRNWDERGQPVLALDATQSQYAQDAAGDALTYAQFFHQRGVGICIRAQLSTTTGVAVILGNWNVTTSNQCARSLYYDVATDQLAFVTTSTLAGGTIHINQKLPAGAIEAGDVITARFLHFADGTWSLDVTREARTAPIGDVATTYSYTGTDGGAPANAAPAYGLAIGARGDHTNYFATVNVFSCAVFTIGATTTADVATWLAYVRGACDFSLLAYDGVARLTYPTNYADTVHQNDSGQAIIAAQGVTRESAVRARTGRNTGTQRSGDMGDSRLDLTGASVAGVTNVRALLQAGAYSFTRVASGPVDDGTGTASRFHFARSAYTTRSIGAQSGHSQRTPSATTWDNWVGAAKSFNDVSLFHVLIGINDLSGVSTFKLDWVDELVRILEFTAQQQLAQVGYAPGVVLYTEPVTGSTTTGQLQHLIRARNRSYMAAVRYLRTFMEVDIVDLNDPTYFP